MSKVKQYVEGLKEHLEYKKIVDISDCEEVGIEVEEILQELDNQDIDYSLHDYFDKSEKLKSLQPGLIYCDKFYVEEK